MILTKNPHMRAFGLVLFSNLGKKYAAIAPSTVISKIALFIFKSPSISFMTLL